MIGSFRFINYHQSVIHYNTILTTIFKILKLTQAHISSSLLTQHEGFSIFSSMSQVPVLKD